jgi:hypothetical protein
MKIVFLITALECLAVSLWLLILWIAKRKTAMFPVLIQQPYRAVSDLASLSETSHWHFLNGWQVTTQGDDRRPMLGGAVSGDGSQAVRRSIARRTHQASYKEWSKERHDYS